MRKSLFVFMLVFILTATDYAAAQQKRMELTALNSMQRISQDQKPTGPREVVIKAARNEVESFQVVVSAFGENINVIKVDISELVGKAKVVIGKENIKLYREEYVRVRRSTPRADLPPGLYADPLVPFIDPVTGKPIEPYSRHRERWGEPIKSSGYRMYALPFEVFRGQNQPLWVDVHIPKDTPAGVYKGSIRVAARGRITDEIPVTLTVWGFTLPDGPTHKNHFGSFRNVARFFNIKRSSQRFNEIEMRYCEEMARHRINPPLPQRLLPDMNDDGSLKIIPERHKELRDFMSRLNVTDFEIPKPPFVKLPRSTLGADYKTISPSNRKKTIRYYRDYYNYLKENGWEKRAYVYMLDEPNMKENYEQVLVLGALVHEAVPQLRCLVVEQTYKQNAEWPDIDPAVDIWCPLWSFIDRESINEKIAHGDEVWSYTALVQRSKPYHKEYEKFRKYDPPYWHIDRPLTVYRVPTWLNRQYNIAGLLYWSTVTMVLEPWTLPAFTSPRHFNGGGYLFYPGKPCGIDGPIACMRLKNIRDGMEDYEYFVILEELAGKEAVDKIVDSVAPEWWQFAKDPQVFLTAREKMANEILRLKNHTRSK